MEKRVAFLFLAAFFLTSAALPQTTYADTTKSTSALLARSQAITPSNAEHDNRAEILRTYLESYNSPMAGNAETFIKEADRNNLDWKLVVSIAGVESQYGHMIPNASYNGWGFGVYGTNVRYFNTWDEGITVVSTTLRENYLGDNQETNVYQIGSKYAADPMWAAKVLRNMATLDAYAAKFVQPTVSISL